MAQHQAVITSELSASASSKMGLYFEELGRKTSSPSLQVVPLPTGRPSDPQPYQIDYVTLENARVLSFAGFGYDVNSGYLVFSHEEHLEPMGIFNLNEYFELVTQGKFNASLFLYNLERFKLGEIENVADIFELDGAGTITVSQGSICKQYLRVMVNGESKSTVTGNNFYEEFKALYRELFTHLRRFGRLLDGARGIQSDTGYLFSTFPSNLRTRMSELSEQINGKGIEATFLPTATMNPVARKELSAKSTQKYLGMRELMRISDKDADDQVMHSLMATDDEIKKVVKASPYKDVVKGAALSGLIKKKEQVVEGISIGMASIGSYLSTMAEIVTKYTSYVKTVFTKVKL